MYAACHSYVEEKKVSHFLSFLNFFTFFGFSSFFPLDFLIFEIVNALFLNPKKFDYLEFSLKYFAFILLYFGSFNISIPVLFFKIQFFFSYFIFSEKIIRIIFFYSNLYLSFYISAIKIPLMFLFDNI